MKMNPEIKAEWIARLRDPERKQAKSYLELEGEGQCCLGVLCEIATENGIISRKTTQGVVFYDEENKSLSKKVIEWAGLENPEYFNTNPSIKSRTIAKSSVRVVSLAEANDYGATFLEIADIIDEEF